MRVAELAELEQTLESNKRDYLEGLAPKIHFQIHRPWTARKRRSVYAGSILELVGVDVPGRTVNLLTHKGIYKCPIKLGDVLYSYEKDPVILYNGKTPAEWNELRDAQEEPVNFTDKLGVPVEPGDTVVYSPATRGATTLEIDRVERLILGNTGLVTVVFESGRRFSRTEQTVDQVTGKLVYRMTTDALVVLKKGTSD